ncbi:MAG: hypothetical protein AB7K24_21735 [Gemmataceae bacterium]
MSEGYSKGDIVVLQGNALVRRRPELYLGPLPDPRVLNRLIEGALCLSFDDAAGGCCTEICVQFDKTGVVSLRDNGPGLPMDPGSDGVPVLQRLLTTLYACREAKKHQKIKSIACQATGLVVVNCLSEWLHIRVRHAGACWFQEYRAGEPVTPFRREGDTETTGLDMTFRPDAALLGAMEFDPLALVAWLPTVGIECKALDLQLGEGNMPTIVHFRELRPVPE